MNENRGEAKKKKHQGTRKPKWSCKWKECTKSINEINKYYVDIKNPRNASNMYGYYCTVIGDTPFPLNKVVAWKIKVAKIKRGNGTGIYVGVTPSDVNQNENNYEKCGWYFYCYESTLWSGPPHNYKSKKYGPRKDKDEQCVHTGDTVGVIMDTTRGDLSFVVHGVKYGVAYDGIPLDKPLVPCAILKNEDDSIELDLSKVTENIDESIPTPSNITVKSITCVSIAFVWDTVEGTSFYQIEMSENKFWFDVLTNEFTKSGLLAGTEYSFRVRVVKENSVSKWSNLLKIKTLKETFETSGWRECPEDVDWDKKYFVDPNNPKITTKIGSQDCSTIIGSKSIPYNRIASWNITLNAWNNRSNIFVGVAPFDIDQNQGDNYEKCGWYLNCFNSTLWSGPPHNYKGRIHGPRKNEGEYICTGDKIVIIINTEKGELSFTLNNSNLGVTFKEIPLDKPLVPCVILKNKGDSVELNILEVVSSLNVPKNITAKSGEKWDSITITWDAIEERVSFYQVETVENRWRYGTLSNTFTIAGLWPETEYGFRVRAVRGCETGKWSDIVTAKTSGKPSTFEYAWQACPGYVSEKRKYCLDEKNSRIATKLVDGMHSVILCNTPVPLGKATSWITKVVKSQENDGNGIFVGVAPWDIYQRIDDEYKYTYNKCGWYLDCYRMALRSGGPHYYCGEKKFEAVKGKKDGEYVHTGDRICGTINTINGTFSFILNGEMDLGVAYEGIPLDKPLVPCVLLSKQGDSVEIAF